MYFCFENLSTLHKEPILKVIHIFQFIKGYQYCVHKSIIIYYPSIDFPNICF